MAELTTIPTAYGFADQGFLAEGLAPGIKTCQIAPIYSTVNGVRTARGFSTPAAFIFIELAGEYERASYGTLSVDSVTKITTLTDMRRELSTTNGSDFTSHGNGGGWPKGTRVVVSNDPALFGAYAITGGANVFTALQTFNAPIIVNGVTSYIQLPSMTEAQRNALTAVNGMQVYVTTGTNANRIHTYEGGAWGVGSSTTISDATEVALGKVELAIVAEHDPSTTGPKVVQAKNIVLASSGAGDAGKIIGLNASGQIPSGFLPASQANPKGNGSNGVLNVTSGTTNIDCTSAVEGVLVLQYTSFNVSVGATLGLTNVPNGGVLVVILSQGAFTMAGTLDGRNGGAIGATGQVVSRTSTGNTKAAGTLGTAPSITVGQERRGAVGAIQGIEDNGSGESWMPTVQLLPIHLLLLQ
jgi:hypothetical protein